MPHKKSRFGSTIRRVAITGFLVIVGLCVALMLAELGTRWLYPVLRKSDDTWATIDRRLDQEDVIQELARGNQAITPEVLESAIPHPYLGYVMDSEVELVRPDGQAARPYSELGFLRGTLPVPNRENVYIIAISGGSVAAQFTSVDGGSLWLRNLLQEDPFFKEKRIVIQSYALPGYKQPQELMALNYLLVLGADFDMWISINGFNDVVLPLVENAPARVASIYPRSWHMLNQDTTNPTEIRLRAAIQAATERRDHLRSVVAAQPVRSSAFARAWWDIADRALEQDLSRLIAELHDFQQKGIKGKRFGPVSLDNAGLGDELVAKQALDVWKRSTRQMAKLCEANNIDYIQFVQPNQYLKGSKELNPEERRIAWANGEGYQPAAELAYPQLVASIPELQADGVPVVDLTAIYHDESRTVYIDTCCHLNDLGNEIMGRHLADEILRVVHARETATASE